MRYLDSAATPASAVKLDETSALKEYANFVGMAFGISWLIWMVALRFGAGPGKGEEFLAFGACGPAVAAIVLSRRRENGATSNRHPSLLRFLLLWVSCWSVYVWSDKTHGSASVLSAPFAMVC